MEDLSGCLEAPRLEQRMEREHFCLDGFPEWKASILDLTYNNTRNLPRDFFLFFFPNSFLPVTIITHTITKTLYRHSRRVARAREHSRDTAAHGMRESALAYAAL